MKKVLLVFLILFPFLSFSQCPSGVMISEFHYDNTGADANEFIELTGPAGTSLTGYSIVFYNGTAAPAAATTYTIAGFALSGTFSNQNNGRGTLSFDATGLQNGASDGFALVGPSGVIEFISYEGVITASGGAANGLTSTNLNVSEDGTGATTGSIQRVNCNYNNWIVGGTNTRNAINSSPLPVTYTSISTRSLENSIELAWGTSAEVGAEKFEIERSSDAREFIKIGQLAAQGESKSKINYSFTDNSPIEGINYYRLRQIDLDGRYEYSKIVSAIFGKEAEALEILGNPTQSNSISLLLKNLPIEQLRLFSSTGQQIPFASTENGNRLEIQPKISLSTGIYYVVLQTNTKKYVKKLAIE